MTELVTHEGEVTAEVGRETVTADSAVVATDPQTAAELTDSVDSDRARRLCHPVLRTPDEPRSGHRTAHHPQRDGRPTEHRRAAVGGRREYAPAGWSYTAPHPRTPEDDDAELAAKSGRRCSRGTDASSRRWTRPDRPRPALSSLSRRGTGRAPGPDSARGQRRPAGDYTRGRRYRVRWKRQVAADRGEKRDDDTTAKILRAKRPDRRYSCFPPVVPLSFEDFRDVRYAARRRPPTPSATTCRNRAPHVVFRPVRLGLSRQSNRRSFPSGGNVSVSPASASRTSGRKRPASRTSGESKSAPRIPLTSTPAVSRLNDGSITTSLPRYGRSRRDSRVGADPRRRAWVVVADDVALGVTVGVAVAVADERLAEAVRRDVARPDRREHRVVVAGDEHRVGPPDRRI